jgi:acyl dehydratase
MAKSPIENTVVAYLDNDDSPDITNPIHSTEVAKSYGFDGPLVGGVTVWGWATDTILEALGEGWLEDGWAEYSFRQPVYPGDTLKVRAVLDENSPAASWTVEMINQQDQVCVSGAVGLGKAQWLNELILPRSMGPTDESDSKGPLTLENAKTGKDWLAVELEFSAEVSAEFIAQKQHTDNPLFNPQFNDKDAIAHPSWTANWAERLLRHNFAIPSSMHTKSRVQHHRKIPIGTTVIGGAHLLDAYERKAHHFANYDVLLADKDGAALAQLRHWTIFRIATADERAKIAD